MNRDIINTGILALSFLSLFVVSEFLYYKMKVNVELTRKLVHIGTGLITLLFPVMLGNQWLVLLLCFTFAVISITSLKFNFLRSINEIDRKSHGTISYIISVYGCYLVYNYFIGKNIGNSDPYIYFYIPIITLAICDPVAALTGKNFPIGKYTIGKDTKTIAGSLAFFVSSFILSISLFFALSHGAPGLRAILPISFTIAIMSTIVEGLSGKGMDNITIPATVTLILILFS